MGTDGAKLAQVNRVVRQFSGARTERLFDASAASLDASRTRVRRRHHRAVPDLNRHFRITLRTRSDRDALLARLRPLGMVDEIIPEPAPVPPPVTPSFVDRQGYLSAGPAGLDVAAMAALPGGRGENVKIIDVEYSWNRDHEDLDKASAEGALIPNGVPFDPFSDSNHGTAVLGELIGDDDDLGVTGLAPGSEIGLVNAAQPGCAYGCWDLANAISTARENASPGDVILVEQQARGRGGASSFVPVEILPAVYDAIRLATQEGIVVVEAGGNGGDDLDSELYGERFPDGKPDSGAIVVGAGSGSCSTADNARLWFSTYGSRVDLQGWGQCVTTTGYGQLFGVGNPNSSYTASFNGTSSAAPIVAAAAALYSSAYQASRGAPPSPEEVRARLIATGKAQNTEVAGHIGPLPDLRALAADFEPVPPAVVDNPPGTGQEEPPATEPTPEPATGEEPSAAAPAPEPTPSAGAETSR